MVNPHKSLPIDQKYAVSVQNSQQKLDLTKTKDLARSHYMTVADIQNKLHPVRATTPGIDTMKSQSNYFSQTGSSQRFLLAGVPSPIIIEASQTRTKVKQMTGYEDSRNRLESRKKPRILTAHGNRTGPNQNLSTSFQDTRMSS